MPTSFLKTHLESSVHFDLSTHIVTFLLSTDVQTKRLPTNHQPIVSVSLFVTSQLVTLNSAQSAINQPTDAQLARYRLVRPLIPPIVKFCILCISLPPYLVLSTYYIRIITPL